MYLFLAHERNPTVAQNIYNFIQFCVGAFFANRRGCEKANSHPLRGTESPRAPRGRATGRAPRQSRRRSQFCNWMRLRREVAARSSERQSKDKPTQLNKRSWQSTAQAFASKKPGSHFFLQRFFYNSTSTAFGKICGFGKSRTCGPTNLTDKRNDVWPDESWNEASDELLHETSDKLAN